MDQKVTMVGGIKVIIEGELSDYAKQLYNERLAIILLKELGVETCEKLLELLKPEEAKVS